MFQDDFGRDTVVPFAQTRSCMRFHSISVVRAYWEALRAGREVPYRSEIDPRGIESALEHTFVLERIAPRIARFRLAGVHLCDLMGMEVRGMPVTAFFAPPARAEIESILGRVFDGPETAELTLAGDVAPGRPQLDARMLLLPMKSDLGDVSHLLLALRLASGIALLVLAAFTGWPWLLLGAAGVILFSAVYDRCPIWNALMDRLHRAPAESDAASRG